jgi:hypothetical protein
VSSFESRNKFVCGLIWGVLGHFSLKNQRLCFITDSKIFMMISRFWENFRGKFFALIQAKIPFNHLQPTTCKKFHKNLLQGFATVQIFQTYKAYVQKSLRKFLWIRNILKKMKTYPLNFHRSYPFKKEVISSLRNKFIGKISRCGIEKLYY